MPRHASTTLIKGPKQGLSMVSMASTGRPRPIKGVGDGTTLYGNMVSASTWSDTNSPYGIYSMSAGPELGLKDVAVNANFKSKAGVFAGDKYYSFYYEQVYSWLGYASVMVFDANTWTLERTISAQAEWKNVPYSSAVTYNAKDSKIYAVNRTSIDGGFVLGTLDTQTGNFDQIAELSCGYLTLAANASGVLYAVAEDGDLYTIDAATGAQTRVGSTGRHPSYAQSMAFDQRTGILYWAYFDGENSALCQVDCATGRTFTVAPFQNHEEFVGLYAVPGDFAAGVPAAPSVTASAPAGSLSVTFAGNGASTDVEGNPWSGTPEESTITIGSGDEVLATVASHCGQSWTSQAVTLPEPGIYTFWAEESNEAGTSPRGSVTLYVGTDMPGAPANVTAVRGDNGIVTITWDAPSAINDGYLDAASLTYAVERFDADGNRVAVGTTAAGVTTMQDSSLPEGNGEYQYAVTATSAAGTGAAGVSNKVFVTGAQELPFHSDFSDGSRVAALYTFVDVDNDATGSGNAVRNTWFWKEDEKLIQFCTDNSHAGNDWLYTPALHLDGTKVYKLRFAVNMGGYSNVRAVLARTTDPATDNVELLDLNHFWDSWQTDKEATFCVEEPGDYYIGLYNYTGTDGSYLNLFNINVTAEGSALVPQAVNDLIVTPGEAGALSATISFTAPSAYMNGKALPASGLQVLVERDGSEVYLGAATPGEKITFVDSDMTTPGVCNYRVLTCVGDGDNSAETTASTYVGVDVPNAVNDLVVTTTDGNMHALMTWNAPAGGVNGGYVNPDALTYTIYRSYDGTEYEEIATGVTATTYTDTQIEEILGGKQDAYFYGVAAVTDGGTGARTSKVIAVGAPQQFPTSESFTNGGFDIQAWTTMALNGYFSWETLRNDDGVIGQDYDKGFIRFYNQWGGDCDSRLVSPAISLKGAEKPMLSFYMYHWEENSIAADNKATKLVIDVQTDGGEWDAPLEEITAAWPSAGWVEHRIDLSQYKDADFIRIGFRGQTDNYWMFYYLDNIRLDEQRTHDLAIDEFYNYGDVKVNSDTYFAVAYTNRGERAASGYDIDLYQGDKLIGTEAGEAIEPGKSVVIGLAAPVTPVMADNDVEYHAEIVYGRDKEPANNVSRTVSIHVDGSAYPVPESLTATPGDSKVSLSWQAPALPDGDVATVDGAEDYEAYAISGFGQWKSIDGDAHYSGYNNGLPGNPNQGKNMGFQIWNSSNFDHSEFPSYVARTGDQCFISWYANTSIDWDTPVNDDWLISPEVKGGTEVSFWIHRANPTEENETYQVAYSSTTPEPSAMTAIGETRYAGADWEQVTVQLPEDARYFAIHYTASLMTAILVDDISYVDVLCALQLQGYNVFRDGQRINGDAPVATTSFDDTEAPEGPHTYHVSAVYDRGESNASAPAATEGWSGIYGVGVDEAHNGALVAPYDVYMIDGRLIGRGLQSIEGLPAGFYLVNGQKVMVK